MEFKKYIVHIGGLSNILNDKDFFFGTGFMGATFDTREELKELIKHYASENGYWKSEYIKLTFNLGTNYKKMKENGDKQCRENGGVNLLSLAFGCGKNPFGDIYIVYRPGGWIKDNKEFKFVVVNEKSGDVIPQFGKLSDILKELGMEL